MSINTVFCNFYKIWVVLHSAKRQSVQISGQIGLIYTKTS